MDPTPGSSTFPERTTRTGPEDSLAGDVARALEESTDDLVTFRFQHEEDKDGHHIVIGRDGTLARCEDEVCA